jgi:H+/Cl- antiporter ClcA
MQKKNIRILNLISLAVAVLGVALMIGSLYGGTVSATPHGTWAPGNLPLFIVGGVILGGACVALFVAYIMSLIKMAQNQQWVWFVLSLVLNFLGFIWSIVPSIIWSFVPDIQSPPPTPGYSALQPDQRGEK